MQFEMLRKSHKRKIMIGGLIIVCVISAITITTTRAKYKLTEDLELAKGTINYKPYDFKVMAMYKSEDKTNYTEINEMPSSGYTINEEKSYCNKSDGTKDTNVILKTIDGNHVIGKLKKNDRCFLYFDKKELIGSEAILGNVTVNTGTPDFSTVATTDEGVFKVEDGIYGGYSYYFRGAVTNNYVKFGGFCWRIVRINGDGSMRLIYDGSSCHANGTSNADSIVKTSVAYNSMYNKSNYVGWTYTGTSQRTLSGTSSNAKTQLESWYSSNLASHAERIADGKYCNDRNVQSGYTWAISPSYDFNYSVRNRVYDKYNPTFSCPSGDVYSLKVGLITADEVEFAGSNGDKNNLYYLFNAQNYWTMSPSRWYYGQLTIAYMFGIQHSGSLDGNFATNNTNLGLRPVINLKADIIISNGNGTLDNPYIIE